MTEQFTLLVAGVLLTGGVGGLFAHYFQSRAWANQRATTNRDQKRGQAIAFYEELSSRLDRRLYRMKRVIWALRGHQQEGGRGRLDEAIDAYEDVLAEWNESINSTLARCEIYFGAEVRNVLENRIHEDFAAAGRVIDIAIGRVRAAGDTPTTWPRPDARMHRLGSVVYDMNLVLLARIRDDAIGASAASCEVSAVPESELPYAEVGGYGPNIEHVQRMLITHGEELSAIDGIFGLETWLALRRFQETHSLHADGTASDETMGLLQIERDAGGRHP